MVQRLPRPGFHGRHRKPLTIGGILAVFAILIRKELLIPLLCLIFFIEDLSVMTQVAYFKYTKARTENGKRVFKMTPIHHHFE